MILFRRWSDPQWFLFFPLISFVIPTKWRLKYLNKDCYSSERQCLETWAFYSLAHLNPVKTHWWNNKPKIGWHEYLSELSREIYRVARTLQFDDCFIVAVFVVIFCFGLVLLEGHNMSCSHLELTLHVSSTYCT